MLGTSDRLSHRLPKAAAEAQFNLLGSRDVSRVLQDLGGDAQLVALALAIQFAYPGIAALYYGDEVVWTAGETLVAAPPTLGTAPS